MFKKLITYEEFQRNLLFLELLVLYNELFFICMYTIKGWLQQMPITNLTKVRLFESNATLQYFKELLH